MFGHVAGVFRTAVAQISIAADGSTSGSVNTTCDLSLYQQGYDQEVEQGLFIQMAECEDTLRYAVQLRFGPPTAWEIFNVMCRGICREYTARYKRLQVYESSTACSCATTQNKCPRDTNEMLCSATNYCYDSEFYQTTTCAPTACGRWATCEADYRNARQACGLYFDSAAPHGLSTIVLIALTAATILLLPATP